MAKAAQTHLQQARFLSRRETDLLSVQHALFCHMLQRHRKRRNHFSKYERTASLKKNVQKNEISNSGRESRIMTLLRD